MIVDTSAMVAILLQEKEQAPFFDLLVRAGASRISAGSWIELSAVIVRKKLTYIEPDLQELMDACAITIVPVSTAQAGLGYDAYRRYGRGSGHPARLNLGDCFAYALAREHDEPLLFKGDDFRHTDVRAAA